jgi:adhesin transport system outer membrane protein
VRSTSFLIRPTVLFGALAMSSAIALTQQARAQRPMAQQPQQPMAQEPTVQEPMAHAVSTFEQIVKQALATHPAILARHSTSLASEAELRGANWQRYPTPSLEMGGDTNSTRTSLFRLQQPLWAGGRITAGISAAEARLHASETAINEARQDIVLRVIGAFVEAMRQQAREEVILEGVGQHERLLAMISRRVEQEASPRVDQDLARSRLFQVSNDLSAVRQALANALTQLSQLAGKRVDKVAGMDPERLPVPASRETALQQTIDVSPTLRRLAFEEEAAEAEVDLRRASYKPQVSLRYEHGSASAPLNGIPGYTTSRVMVVVEAQPGAGLSALSGVDAAIARRESTRLQRDTALRDLRERVSMDWDELIAAANRLANSLVASGSSKEVFESYARQYTAGRKTWLDVLNTVREATQSDLAVVDSRAQVTGARLRLQLETGNFTGPGQ